MTWQEESNKQEREEELSEEWRKRKIQIEDKNGIIVAELSYAEIEDLSDSNTPSGKRKTIDKLCLLFDQFKRQDAIIEHHEDKIDELGAEVEKGKNVKAELEQVKEESEKRDRIFKAVTGYRTETFIKIRDRPAEHGDNILPSHYKVLRILHDIGPVTFSDWLRGCIKANLTRHDNTLNRWIKSLRGLELITRDDATEMYSVTEKGKEVLSKVEGNIKRIT